MTIDEIMSTMPAPADDDRCVAKGSPIMLLTITVRG